MLFNYDCAMLMKLAHQQVAPSNATYYPVVGINDAWSPVFTKTCTFKAELSEKQSSVFVSHSFNRPGETIIGETMMTTPSQNLT